MLKNPEISILNSKHEVRVNINLSIKKQDMLSYNWIGYCKHKRIC
ncbi:hypothetical protein bsdtw1_02443 [Clostridium fungisolvens]|uniref:Uncharacterized protein n=1 Tax=Clostridium fungisolvens TaxID=1604897 RepID=A0A6V8SHS5_9CLOT|nr:hypothetical protein bsdtw1_02443 [Clostridium fungisolvens]